MLTFPSPPSCVGLGVLFSKLQQGTIENRQVLTVARLRAEAEEAYGSKLAEIAPSADRFTGGFGKDDGATVRKVSQMRNKAVVILSHGAFHRLSTIVSFLTNTGAIS